MWAHPALRPRRAYTIVLRLSSVVFLSFFRVNLYCISALALSQVLGMYIYSIQNSLRIGVRGTIMLSSIVFYLNALVRTYCYQFGLFTLSLLLFEISYYFSLNCHLNGHTGRKIDAKKDILPVLTVVRRLFTIHKKCFGQFLSDFNFVWFVWKCARISEILIIN